MDMEALEVDEAAEAKRIVGFIADMVRGARAQGVVLGLSGGVDSAVTGALCVEALGKARVLTILMPSAHTPREDVEDARKMAKEWGVTLEELEIDEIVRVIMKTAKIDGERIPKGNLQARVRMAILYAFANSKSLLVAGTGDRSESELGYFTKFGDGGADFLPIAHLYKTQVRVLGAHLGLPDRVVKKAASPQLWPGQKASDELHADYDVLDPLLYLLFEKRVTLERAASESGAGKELVEKVMRMHDSTEHKRRTPPSLRPKA